VKNDLYDILMTIQNQYTTEAIANTTQESTSSATQWNGKWRGVVHSFDDTLELAQLFMNDLGLYIGLNGCSLRTKENLATVQQLPLDRILLETE
jgi:Tat protein secretion system quality control protein TatD with DNase activity